jgi:uncharacterized protein (TIGR01777 family)
MAILVTGATGLIGRSLMKSLLDDHETINILSRDSERAQAFFNDPKVRAFAWQPSTEDIPPDALEDVQTIFHLMGETVGGRWTKSKVDAIVASRVTSAQKISSAIKGRPCRVVSASSFGIYLGQRGAIYEETAPLPPPITQIQDILQAVERAVAEASAPETKVNMVRFGMVCAADGYPKKLVRLFRKGFAFMVGDGEQIIPIVDLEDAVSMLRWVASGQAGEGPVNCVAPASPQFKEVAQAIASHVEKRVRFSIPDWLARPLLGGSADYFLLSYEVTPRKALDRGYNFRHSEPRDILRRAIAGA